MNIPVTTFARGGGCFLAGTLIGTPDGKQVPIETLKAGNQVVSYNESTGQQEVSTIGAIDVLERDHYYLINGITKVTGEHPFYTTSGIVEVQDLTNHRLVGRWDAEVPILSLTRFEETVQVYNLLDVSPNNNYYADNLLVHNKGGGGCFLADTPINTPDGSKFIQDFKPGDTVLSYNEKTEDFETSTVERLEILASREYYYLNYDIKVTGEHPFYVVPNDEEGYPDYEKLVVKKVSELKVGDTLKTHDSFVEIRSKQLYVEDVVIYNLINVEPNHNYYAAGYLVHNKGASGHASSSHASSSHSSSSPKPSSSTKSTSSASSTPAAPAKPAVPKTSSKAGTSKATPGSTIKTVDGKVVKSSTAKPTNKSYTKSAGIVGDNGYTPRYTNGYYPPAGSVVYQQNTSAMDYFFLYYIFSHNDPARPQNQTQTVVQPDGKQVVAHPQPSGVDGLMIFNWIIFILFIIAIIGGLAWFINKKTKKDTPTLERRNGWA